MCVTLYNPDTEQEIQDQQVLADLVGLRVWQQMEEQDPEPGFCLCDINFEDMLSAAGYQWEPVNGNTDDILFRKKQPHEAPTRNPQ